MEVLDEAGYEVAPQLSPSCFDIIARKKEILLVKVLSNIDSIYEEQASDLKRVARILNAKPLIIGFTAGGTALRDRTLYQRHGVPAISFETFKETMLEKKMPFIYSHRGGFYAQINPDFLKKVREQLNLSLNDLAREAGISRKAVYNYEHGEGAEIENVLRLQEAIGDLLLEPLDPFSCETSEIKEAKPQTPLEGDVTSRLSEMGFTTESVTRTCFRIIGSSHKDILLTGFPKKPLDKRAKDIHGIAKTLQQHGMFVTEKKAENVVEGVPVVDKGELEEIVTSRELIKLLKEISE
jgi:putative transcriptional regulator